MNIAIIFAGGTGKRMKNNAVPKQFLEYKGKPILLYTLDIFQRHKEIDGIILVSLKDYVEKCWGICKENNITKISSIVSGGATAQESIFLGLKKAEELYSRDSLVFVHDGVRPLITEETISDALVCANRFGNAIPVTPASDTICINSTDEKLGEIVDRERCLHAKAPQVFRLEEIISVHKKAKKEEKVFIDCASMMQYYGRELYTFECSTDNIKITTPIDFYVFKGLMEAKSEDYHS